MPESIAEGGTASVEVPAGNDLQVRNPNGVQHLEDQMLFILSLIHI